MRARRTVAALIACVAVGALVGPTPNIAEADDDYGGGPDENVDVTSPGQRPADTRPTVPAAAPAAAEADSSTLSVFAAAAAAPGAIDDFRYDELVLEGTAAEVCAGRLLTGSGWTFNAIVARFGGTAGTMYFCRERWDAANDPACNGQQANPVTTPNFHSTCWSNHAMGRAIDVMVGGSSGGGYNTSRGLAIVNWLLASDALGNVNANARKLGIQQILFNDRCWNSSGDRGIASWTAMRPCGIGHFDHVHLDLTLNGANGTVSYWGYAPEIEPKFDVQVFWEQSSAWREAISWFNLRSRSEEGLAVPSQYDQIVVGDLDRDGIQDETFLWDSQTGNWALQNWNAGDSLTARIGTWSRSYDRIVMADLDGDGYVNDMFLWDRDTNRTSWVSWSNYSSYARGTGILSGAFDQLYAADLDGNGLVNDFLAWDVHSGKWAAYSWSGYRMSTRAIGYFTVGYDRAVFGDWSAGGDLDEMLLWDLTTGTWRLYSWAGFKPTYERPGSWSVAIDVAAPGDYDSDGRVDDVFVYDTNTGQWAIYSFHRNVARYRTSGRWGVGFDVITVGSFLN